MLAYYSLPTAHCLLRNTTYCLLPTVYILLTTYTVLYTLLLLQVHVGLRRAITVSHTPLKHVADALDNAFYFHLHG